MNKMLNELLIKARAEFRRRFTNYEIYRSLKRRLVDSLDLERDNIEVLKKSTSPCPREEGYSCLSKVYITDGEGMYSILGYSKKENPTEFDNRDVYFWAEPLSDNPTEREKEERLSNLISITHYGI